MGDAAAVSGGTLFLSTLPSLPATKLFRGTSLGKLSSTFPIEYGTIRVTAIAGCAGSGLMTYGTRSDTLPLGPLLAAYRPLRVSAHPASALCVEFLDTASNEVLATALHKAANAALPVPFHSNL